MAYLGIVEAVKARLQGYARTYNKYTVNNF